MRYPGTWQVTGGTYGGDREGPALTLTPEQGNQLDGMVLGTRVLLLDPGRALQVLRMDPARAAQHDAELAAQLTAGPGPVEHQPTTPDDLYNAVDLHLLQALEAMTRAEGDDRQLVEERIRDRLVAIHDSFPTVDKMAARLAYLLPDQPRPGR